MRKVAYNAVADGLHYHPDKSTACTLFGGTSVAQVREGAGEKGSRHSFRREE